MGGDGQEHRERGERHQGHGDEASPGPNERDAAPDAYRRPTQPGEGREAASQVACDQADAGEDRRDGEAVDT